MNGDNKATLIFCAIAAVFFLSIFALIGVASHYTNEQILRCYEMNKHRPMPEAKGMCIR